MRRKGRAAQNAYDKMMDTLDNYRRGNLHIVEVEAIGLPIFRHWPDAYTRCIRAFAHDYPDDCLRFGVELMELYLSIGEDDDD